MHLLDKAVAVPRCEASKPNDWQAASAACPGLIGHKRGAALWSQSVGISPRPKQFVDRVLAARAFFDGQQAAGSPLDDDRNIQPRSRFEERHVSLDVAWRTRKGHQEDPWLHFGDLSCQVDSAREFIAFHENTQHVLHIGGLLSISPEESKFHQMTDDTSSIRLVADRQPEEKVLLRDFNVDRYRNRLGSFSRWLSPYRLTRKCCAGGGCLAFFIENRALTGGRCGC